MRSKRNTMEECVPRVYYCYVRRCVVQMPTTEYATFLVSAFGNLIIKQMLCCCAADDLEI